MTNPNPYNSIFEHPPAYKHLLKTDRLVSVVKDERRGKDVWVWVVARGDMYRVYAEEVVVDII